MKPFPLLATLALLPCTSIARSLPGNTAASSDSNRLGSSHIQPTTEHPFGWRGDGTGRYPAADPPLHWGHESVAVSQLRCQAAKPQPGETGQPIRQGVIGEWLVAGPITLPEDFDPEADTVVPNAGALRPGEGEVLAGTAVKWKTLAVENSVLDWSALLGRNHKVGLPDAEVLAHAYVYSPSGGPIACHSMHNIRGQVFVNGKKKWRIARWDYKETDATDPNLKAYFKDGMDNVCSALLRQNLGGVPLVFSAKFVVRATDGKLLTTIGEGFYDRFSAAPGYSTPIINGSTMYRMCKQQDNGGLVDLQVWSLPASAAEPFTLKKEKSIHVDTQRFPIWAFGEQNAALLYHEGLIYCVSADGVLSVVDVEKGEVAYQQLLDADLFMHSNYGAGRGGMAASPTLAGKYIYLFGNQGTCLVIEPGRTFKLVARNRVENVVNGHQDIMASSPVFEDNRMYYRTDGYVYCIEKKP